MKTIVSILALFMACHVFASEKLPELVIAPLQEGVYLHQSFSYVDGFGLVSANGLVVIDDNKAFIIDTPWSERDTAKLVGWIEKQNYQLIGSISTHWHEDRTAGIKWLNEHGIATYAYALTNELLQKHGKALALHSFSAADVSLADGVIEAFYPGAGHATDNIVVWLPKSQLLFGGCLVRSLDSTSLGFTGDADVAQWPDSISQVIAKFPNVKSVVPGHGDIGDGRLLKRTKQLADLAVQKVKPLAANAPVK